jgi:hypothetical protein
VACFLHESRKNPCWVRENMIRVQKTMSTT